MEEVKLLRKTLYERIQNIYDPVILKKLLSTLDSNASELEILLRDVLNFPLPLCSIIAAYGKDYPFFKEHCILWLTSKTGVKNKAGLPCKDNEKIACWENQISRSGNAEQSNEKLSLIYSTSVTLNGYPIVRSPNRTDYMRGKLMVPSFKTMVAVFRDTGSIGDCIHPVVDCNYNGVASCPGKTNEKDKYISSDGHGHISRGHTLISYLWVVGVATYEPTHACAYLNGRCEGMDEDRSNHPRTSFEYLIASREDGYGRDFVGDIVEVLIYDIVLTKEQISDLSSFLITKYKLTDV